LNGFDKTELGKIILAACFINDLGTVLALGVVFTNFDYWLALFGAVTAAALWPLVSLNAVSSATGPRRLLLTLD
jgi:hypothetical protein